MPPKKDPIERHYTVEQVSELLCETPTNTRRRINRGEIPAKTTGRRLLVAESDLSRYLKDLPRASTLAS